MDKNSLKKIRISVSICVPKYLYIYLSIISICKGPERGCSRGHYFLEFLENVRRRQSKQGSIYIQLLETSSVKMKLCFNYPLKLGFTQHGGSFVVQSLSHVQLFVTEWTEHQSSLSFATSWSLLKLMPIESVMPSNHLFLCLPLSSCPQPFQVSESFPMGQFSTDQSIGASVSASVLPMNIQD